MKRFFWLACLLSFPVYCLAQKNMRDSLLQYVHPIIGTERMGHTYPGATVPFGMVQLSPDTDTIPFETNGHYNPEVYAYCAGYQYEDSTIVGFSHTHFSGTGHSDLGDFLIMPTVGKLQLNPGTASDPNSGFRSRFSHATEVSEPDYYKVKLSDYDITAELTASTRVGFHQYTFPKSNQAHIILDMMHNIYNYPGKDVWTYIHVVNDTLVTGYRQTDGWARTRTLYFAMVFSKPFTSYGWHDFTKSEPYHGFWGIFDQYHNFPEMAARDLRAYFNFQTSAGEKIKIKMAISPVSMDGALLNLRTEIPGWNFDKVKQAGQDQWEKQLEKIVVKASTPDKVNFYTAMYHAFINPTVYMDVDSLYEGLDKNVHRAKNFTNYTTFSLWDTYRALHPLFNIIQGRRDEDMIKSMLAHFDQSPEHMLPVWANSANENWCMTGYHAVAVIADAVIKGNDSSFNANRALDACITTANNRSYEGLGYYLDKGYIPVDKDGSGVSTTLEFAYDDWAIAQLAKKLNRMDVYNEFMKRAQNYKNVYDPSVGFMRGRLSDGSFMKNFDPLSTSNQGFVEGNSWNYTLSVAQDPPALIKLMGGEKKFTTFLDSLFTMHLSDQFFAHTEDITREGIIGGYVHGNEPSHHIAYLYDWTNEPWKTQKYVRYILKDQYQNGPAGLKGNDDCGQMSAWFIFSTLGFYPVAPGSDVYKLGSPAIDKATLHLANGKTFTIIAKDQSDKNVYVKSVELNGQPIKDYSITHQQIMDGGTLIFHMSNHHS